jgi:site-specific DNA recombinase
LRKHSKSSIGLKTKSWITQKNTPRNGSGFDRPALIRILTNALYIGEVRHAGSVYPGEQAPIIHRETWSRANQLLSARKRRMSQS